MKPVSASEPGDPTVPNEDWSAANQDSIVVLDGATARIDTGCRHGIAWYVDRLGSELMDGTMVRPRRMLRDVLADGIRRVAAMHPECDLTHPGTPSAGVAMVRLCDDRLEYLVLADTIIVVRTHDGNIVLTDDRVRQAAHEEKEAAMALPFGSDERSEALKRMKRRQQECRNRPGGFWVAAANPDAADYAIRGSVALKDATDVAVLTDGAARCVMLFETITWTDVIRILNENGPADLIREVRETEASDPSAERWTRAKGSDDATVVYAALP
ncbi:protein phosphatase 2C domain-containing protein [Actinoplanes sp. NPDC051346]|uniref:protein phosphatase 2C domain-containing protein n=1 Tax=Actinoplanes sp. NPDC051346 TaxID=3155048 RepID=UPI0034440C0E